MRHLKSNSDNAQHIVRNIARALLKKRGRNIVLENIPCCMRISMYCVLWWRCDSAKLYKMVPVPVLLLCQIDLHSAALSLRRGLAVCHTQEGLQIWENTVPH